MSDSKLEEKNMKLGRLLQDVLNLFDTFGVIDGEGVDGALKSRIKMELSGVDTSGGSASFRTPTGRCPLCFENILDCYSFQSAG